MTSADGIAAQFEAAVAGLRAVAVRPEIVLSDLPAPSRLAPYAYAVAAEVLVRGKEQASGRLVVLHDPAGQESWRGTTRLVVLVRADLDPEMAGDPLLAGVGWSWLQDSLAAAGAPCTAVGGTVTRTSSVRFGEMGDGSEQDIGEIELRASWTPLSADLGPHFTAWCGLLATAAGLPPPGVAALLPLGG